MLDEMEKSGYSDAVVCVYSRVFVLCAKRCMHCNNCIVHEIRNATMLNMQLVCKSWLRAYKRFVLFFAVTSGNICVHPITCAYEYAVASPPLPFLLRVFKSTSLLNPREVNAKLKNQLLERSIDQGPY